LLKAVLGDKKTAPRSGACSEGSRDHSRISALFISNVQVCSYSGGSIFTFSVSTSHSDSF